LFSCIYNEQRKDMTTALFVLAAVAAALLASFLVRRWLKWRGARLITCPENQRPAGVHVDLKTALFGREHRLNDCSRWPEKKNCGQECLREIKNSPDGCLVVSILAGWYAGRNCAYCRKPVGEINWQERKPALLSPEGQSVEWHEVRPEQIPDVLATHRAICWNCHIIETFRRQHPELVVERSR
jgi:hypothetical protein